MKVPQMGITLKPDYKPSFIKKKKQVPLHWKASVNKEKEKLIWEGIIEKFKDPPAFISLNEVDRFRLVVNL